MPMCALTLHNGINYSENILKAQTINEAGVCFPAGDTDTEVYNTVLGVSIPQSSPESIK